MMARPLVLITGATGMIGFATLLEALESGYRARVAVHGREALETIRRHYLIRPHAESIEYVPVPDPLAVGAYDSAAQGVDYIIHLASSLPDSFPHESILDVERDIFNPAIQDSVGILRSATDSPTVRRIVSSSPLSALAPSSPGAIVGPYDLASPPSSTPMDTATALRAAKILGHHASTQFMTTSDPSPRFSLIRLHPASVIGRNELATSSSQVRSGDNEILIDLVSGGPTSSPPVPRFGIVAHVNDVARAFVLALSPHLSIPSGSSFILAANKGVPVDWNDASDVVQALFPEAVQSGMLSLERDQPSIATGMFDVSETESVLGLEFRSFEEAVRSVVGQYIELLEYEMED